MNEKMIREMTHDELLDALSETLEELRDAQSKYRELELKRARLRDEVRRRLATTEVREETA